MTNGTTANTTSETATNLGCNRPTPRRSWYKTPAYAIDLVSGPVLKTLLCIIELNGDLPPAELPSRLLASRRGVDPKTIYNHCRALEKANVLRILRGKTSWCRNTPNRFIPLDVNGEPLYLNAARNCREKIKTELKTNTAKTDPVNREREDDHPPAMRRLYELNGRLMRSRHERRDQTRQYFAYRANVGVYSPAAEEQPTAEQQLSDAAERAAYWERYRAKRAAEEAAAEQRRQEIAAAEERSRQEREARYAADPSAERAEAYLLMLRNGGRYGGHR